MPATSRSRDPRLGLVAAGPEVLVALREVDQVALARRRDRTAARRARRAASACCSKRQTILPSSSTGRGHSSCHFAGRRLVQTSGGSTTWSSTEIIRRSDGRVRSHVGRFGHAAPRGASREPEELDRVRRTDPLEHLGGRAARPRATGRARSRAARRRTGRPTDHHPIVADEVEQRPQRGRLVRERVEPQAPGRSVRRRAAFDPGRVGVPERLPCGAGAAAACRRRGSRRRAGPGSARRSRWPPSRRRRCRSRAGSSPPRPSADRRTQSQYGGWNACTNTHSPAVGRGLEEGQEPHGDR